MKRRELCVIGGYLVIGVDYPQLSSVLVRMLVEAENEQHTAQRPDVCLSVDAVVVVEIEHLWRPVARRRLLGDLVLDEAPLVHRPRVVRLVDSGGGAAKVAQFDLIVARDQVVL